MPQQVQMIRVMIASPSDVAKEREIIRKTIHDWNDVHAQDRSIVLMPIGWETHSSPEMNDRPQAIITKQILQDCDLLVAAFWTRLGSHTGTSASGTVEEIEEHLRAGKQAMLYFSSAPVKLDSVDQENYAALRAFKDECKQRGLITEYESLSQFQELFGRHLAQTVIRQFANRNSAETPTATHPPPLHLSSDAQQLLQEAAKTSDGAVMMLSTLSGLTISTNETTFAEGGDARNEARWRSALLELFNNFLLEDRGGHSEVFTVTHRGYDVANMLGPIQHEPDPLD